MLGKVDCLFAYIMNKRHSLKRHTNSKAFGAIKGNFIPWYAFHGMLVPQGYDLKALEQIPNLRAIFHHACKNIKQNFKRGKYDSLHSYKGNMPLKQGYTDT
jgi:hypothetical protein